MWNLSFAFSVPAVAEQVIDVPKLAFPVQRAALSEPQLVEQLVEVPTVLSYSLLQQRTAKQIVDTPVPHGRGGGARGGLQGFSQGQDSTAVSGADHVNTPVFGRGGGARGGLPGLSRGQGSTAVYESGQRSAEQNVDIPAPSFRSRRARRTAEQNVDIPVRRSRAHVGLQGSTARGGAQGASWLRSGAEELEARLEAELEELLAISADTGFTPQQEARFNEVLRELSRF